jgi:hypothetical protein
VSESAPSPTSLPCTIMGRSPFDEVRLRWQGAGNLLLALYCMFGVGGIGGVIFGILFILLAGATWTITSFGRRDWYSIPPNGRIIAGFGAVIGVAFVYIFFGIFFFTIWFIMLIANWLA